MTKIDIENFKLLSNEEKTWVMEYLLNINPDEDTDNENDEVMLKNIHRLFLRVKRNI